MPRGRPKKAAPVLLSYVVDIKAQTLAHKQQVRTVEDLEILCAMLDKIKKDAASVVAENNKKT